jgi:hypothetical protein
MSLRALGAVALVSFVAISTGCGSADDPAPLDTTGGVGTGNGAAGSGGSDITRPRNLPYPEGPYGTSLGAIIQNFEFLGWRDPVANEYDPEKFERVSMADFYDPTGETTKLIWLNASAVWCSVCRSEYRDLRDQGVVANYSEKGIKFVSAIFEDNNYDPSTPNDLKYWGQLFSVEFPMVLDPGFKLGAFFDADATPMNMLIDARTMKVIRIDMGYGRSFAYLDTALASLGN